MDYITITKKPGIKNCVRINSIDDIPDFLKDSITIEGDQLSLDCLEGKEKAPIGSVIAYEKLDNGKMNVWNKANWATTTREVDGVFYELPKPNKALPLENELPLEIVKGLGDRLTKKEDGSFQIDAGWGLVSCAPNNGYLVIYGQKEDGSLDANFLTKGTPSFSEYYIMDEKTGIIVQSLAEYDQQLTESKIKGTGKKM